MRAGHDRPYPDRAGVRGRCYVLTRPRHLELFAGGCGSAWGWVMAGFDVVAIDNHRRLHLPESEHLTFIKADAVKVLLDIAYLRTFESLGGGPPCQTHTRAKHLRDAQGKQTDKIDLIPETRAGFEQSGRPYVIENVPEAPLRHDLLLCGSMFPELRVHDDTGQRWLRRHRVFETNVSLSAPGPCDHRGAGVRALGIYGSKADNVPSGGQTARTLDEGRALMGNDWMSWSALVESVPWRYTEFIGAQLVTHLQERAT